MARYLMYQWQMLGFIAVLAFLAIVPVETLKTFPVLCTWRNLLGINCPTCGLTRAVCCLLHGRFADAFAYNPLVFVIIPLAVLHVVRRARK